MRQRLFVLVFVACSVTLLFTVASHQEASMRITAKSFRVLGDATRRLRFALSPGIHVYLGSSARVLLLEPARARLATGPLFVHPTNKRYFTDGTSRAIYLAGAHTWLNLQDGGAEDPPPAFDYTAFLDFLEAHNHNFFRLWTWEQAQGVVEYAGSRYFAPHAFERTGPGLALDGKPKFDLTKFNHQYFQRLRQRIIAARDRGFYVAVMLFNGWSASWPKGQDSTGNPWLGHPFNRANNINNINGDTNNDGDGSEIYELSISDVTEIQDRYVKRVIDSVNDLDNVLYEVANETNSTKRSLLWQYHMIELVRMYEAGKPKQHPIGMTAEFPGGRNEDLYTSSADWISPHGGLYDRPVADGRKVVVADTDHLCGICGDRRWVWSSFTRGENALFMDQYDDSYKLNGGGYKQSNPNDVSLRRNLGYVLSYANRVDLATMVPRGDLVSSGYALANPTPERAEYLAYLPEGGTVVVNLSTVSGQLSGEWFNPSNGTRVTGLSTHGGGNRSFTAPFSGDALLYIYYSAKASNSEAVTLEKRRPPQT